MNVQADPPAPDLTALRAEIRAHIRAPEAKQVRWLSEQAALPEADRLEIVADAASLVRDLRDHARPGLMEVFLAEYGLSTDEGLALMCLAEALLRVPDAETVDALIEDKIGPGEWIEHFGHSGSMLVNASTLGLALTGRILSKDEAGGLLRSAARRLGEPLVRAAVTRAMREMGRQFVLGQTIDEAAERAEKLERDGFTYSYDMLGEAAMTAADADAFFASYQGAISALTKRCKAQDTRDNPGISIKLSALHPRYEESQRARVLKELVPRVLDLAQQAKAAGMGLNIDAEEADRLDLSLDVIAAVLGDESLAGWDGFGVVVQGYGKRAPYVVDWLYALAEGLDRSIMVRLVKGAYWDAEIKLAQVEGLDGFPVFTRKSATDVSYIAVARQLLGMTDRIYPQFATHNAHTVAAILHMAEDLRSFEFQRLHGMGEALHAAVKRKRGTRCRIYAPVGRHRELLAYLVRRLLENGANSSFVNQVVDERVPPERVAADPFEDAEAPVTSVVSPPALFAPRSNSRGWDLTDPVALAGIEAARAPFRGARWKVGPIVAAEGSGGEVIEAVSPTGSGAVGTVTLASPADVEAALAAARVWDAPVAERAEVLRRASDLYEARFGEIFALLAQEAGKTLPDAVSELREAVDFLRYYAGEAREGAPRGVFACISPWNFPLAIFTGQIAAALAAGNSVIAKPAEETPLIAALAVGLLHEAGVPPEALQLLPGAGDVGAALTSDRRVDGVCFTGSTETAQAIHRAMAEALDPGAPLIAETGGINAMIVDSTALPEQAVRDVVASAFQSAGQRCSACRVLYVQEDVAEPFLTMLQGAMAELAVGDPWELATDVGPVIDAGVRDGFTAYVEAARAEGRLIAQGPVAGAGHLFAPALVRVGGISDVAREVFGPVLHVASFGGGEIDAVVDAINARGFGLTFGLHTRITARAARVTERIEAGNSYVNRNQIGAVVGSQPFGGEGLSGTGPKAGGPDYVARFYGAPRADGAVPEGEAVPLPAVQALVDAVSPPANWTAEEWMPGPTGESNRLRRYPRGIALCLGPTVEDAARQRESAMAHGCVAVTVAHGASGQGALDGRLAPEDLQHLGGIALVASFADEASLRAIRQALAARGGPILPLVTSPDETAPFILERHVCTDTTAAGGNATLLAGSG
ncbi:bifunctional proline dehydrogenase/L-glutamate gamma-semialdehyde dehydrogenase PutA [Aestuariibius insulae]|uniref:bifunctional proline dehydrogenase/L-glutamate gamma-semialdehyde dehydrogenase PutA n=1 Tax=Aestuariibius insulae TaxID=2058287 RepID=UPI00345E7813